MTEHNLEHAAKLLGVNRVNKTGRLSNLPSWRAPGTGATVSVLKLHLTTMLIPPELNAPLPSVRIQLCGATMAAGLVEIMQC